MNWYGIGWIRSATGSATVRRSRTSASPSSTGPGADGDQDRHLLSVPLLRDHGQRRRGGEADRRRDRVGLIGAHSRKKRSRSTAASAGEEQRAGVDLGPDRMQRQLERRHDPEVAAASAQTPEEVGVLVLARMQEPAVGGDDVGADEVVAGKAVLPHQPADAAAEREARDAGGRDEPAGGGEAELLRLVVDVAPDGAGADERARGRPGRRGRSASGRGRSPCRRRWSRARPRCGRRRARRPQIVARAKPSAAITSAAPVQRATIAGSGRRGRRSRARFASSYCSSPGCSSSPRSASRSSWTRRLAEHRCKGLAHLLPPARGS